MSTTDAPDAQAWFDRWVDTYDADRRVLIPCFDAFYGTAAEAAALDRPSGARVLDLGAGTGLLSSVLAGSLPDATFVLLDEAPAMLDRAVERLAPLGDRVRTVVADLREPLPEGPFDVVASALAIHHLDDAGKASYTFDVQWAVPPLTDLDSVAHIHTGCFSATMEPGGSVVVETMRQVRDNGTVSYDPNVRPSLMGTPEQVVPRVEELVALSDVVKASDEDLEWLYPDTPVEDVMRRWLKLGPSVMVTTRGPWGAYAMIRHSRNMLVVDPVNVSSTLASLLSVMKPSAWRFSSSTRTSAPVSWSVVPVTAEANEPPSTCADGLPEPAIRPIASATTTMICQVPEPIREISRSPIRIPMETLTTSSTARRHR